MLFLNNKHTAKGQQGWGGPMVQKLGTANEQQMSIQRFAGRLVYHVICWTGVQSTLTKGARQLVVHEALEMMSSACL